MSCRLIKIKQKIKTSKIKDVRKEVESEIENLKIKFKGRIAVAVGSRGIANLPIMVKQVVDSIKKNGGEPFIVPSMGSHGGANASGQTEILESLGVNEKTMGVPIISSMEVIELPKGNLKNKVFIDKNAFESDGIVVINRIKPHSDFHGPYESGLAKMCVIGLGKHKGALELHSFGVQGLLNQIPPTAEKMIATGKILMGLAIVENPKDETTLIRALHGNEIMKEEPALLKIAKENMPSLPVNNIDILLTKQIGKNISGTGFDPNIIGRLKISGVKEPEKPSIQTIVLDDLTEESHGNAVGVGFADIITKQVHQKINFKATYENVITSTFIERAKVPLVAENAKRALEIAIRVSGNIPEKDQRIVYIKNTLHIDELYVSAAIFNEIQDRVDIIGDGEPVSPFDGNGNLAGY